MLHLNTIRAYRYSLTCVLFTRTWNFPKATHCHNLCHEFKQEKQRDCDKNKISSNEFLRHAFPFQQVYDMGKVQCSSSTIASPLRALMSFCQRCGIPTSGYMAPPIKLAWDRTPPLTMLQSWEIHCHVRNGSVILGEEANAAGTVDHWDASAASRRHL